MKNIYEDEEFEINENAGHPTIYLCHESEHPYEVELYIEDVLKHIAEERPDLYMKHVTHDMIITHT